MRSTAGLALLLILCAGLTLAAVAFDPAAVNAQTPAAPDQGPDLWREKTIADFEKWRRDIPDYEKRLYDRVKIINSRTVRLTNVIIGGFVVLFMTLVIGFVLTIGHLRRHMEGGSPLSTEPAKPTEIRDRLHDLRQRQAKLRSAIDDLRLYFQEAQAHHEDIQWLRRSAADRVKALEGAVAAVGPDVPGDLRKKQSKLARALDDFGGYCDDSRTQAEGLSRLVASAERNLSRLDGMISELPVREGRAKE